MKHLRLILVALFTLCISTMAVAAYPQMVLKNQFGETSINRVTKGGIYKFTSAASVGGAASEVFTVTGLLATDTILSVSQSIKGANSLPLLGFNTQAANALTGVYSADPGAAAKIVVTVLR